MRGAGGSILAISVDAPAVLRRLALDEGLAFRLLSDAEGEVIRAYGVVHAGGGLDGEAIAVPAQVLLRPDGTIAWRHVAERITDRPPPEQILAAIREL